MQISSSLKDKVKFIFSTYRTSAIRVLITPSTRREEQRVQKAKRIKEDGFTILECILAVGILSAVLASLVGLQSSIIFVAQNSMDKLKAVWAMRQANSQIDYVLNAAGFAGVPENADFVWSGDNKFSINVKRKDLNDIKPSQFLTTALKFNNLANGNPDEDTDRMIAPIKQFIDNIPMGSNSGSAENNSITKTINESNFVNVFINVNWTSGSTTMNLNDGLFLMDNATLANIQLPNLGTTPNGSTPNNNAPNNTPNNSPSNTGDKK